MKVNLYKESNVKVAILNTISSDPTLIQRIINARNPELKDGNDPCEEVVFTINGIEVDFNNFIDTFSKQYNKTVELRANEILKTLERKDLILNKKQESKKVVEGQFDMFNYKLAEIAHEIDKINLNELTPIDALNTLVRIKEKMQ